MEPSPYASASSLPGASASGTSSSSTLVSVTQHKLLALLIRGKAEKLGSGSELATQFLDFVETMPPVPGDARSGSNDLAVAIADLEAAFNFILEAQLPRQDGEAAAFTPQRAVPIGPAGSPAASAADPGTQAAGGVGDGGRTELAAGVKRPASAAGLPQAGAFLHQAIAASATAQVSNDLTSRGSTLSRSFAEAVLAAQLEAASSPPCPVLHMSPAQAVDVVDSWRLPDTILAPTNPDEIVCPPTGMEDVGLRLTLAEPTGVATPYQRLLLGIYVHPDQVAGPSRDAFLEAHASAAAAGAQGGGPAVDLTRPTYGSRRRFFFICRFSGFLAFKNGLQRGLSPNDAFQSAKGWLFALLGP